MYPDSAEMGNQDTELGGKQQMERVWCILNCKIEKNRIQNRAKTAVEVYPDLQIMGKQDTKSGGIWRRREADVS